MNKYPRFHICNRQEMMGCLVLICVSLAGCASAVYTPTDANSIALTNADAYMILDSITQEACLSAFASTSAHIQWTPTPTLVIHMSGPVVDNPVSDRQVRIRLADITDIHTEPDNGESHSDCPSIPDAGVSIHSSHHIWTEWYIDNTIFIIFPTAHDANLFVTAVYRIKHPVQGITSMPGICETDLERNLRSEATTTQARQAAAAVERKDYMHAIRLYEQLQKDAPCWATAYYNSALILADSHDLDDAINDMKIYVQLVPAATDVQQVQNKIAAWEGQRQENQ